MDVASIERDASEVMRLAAVEVADQGGESFVGQFLRGQLRTLVAVAFTELGPANTCQLMFEGLKTAEAMAAESPRL